MTTPWPSQYNFGHTQFCLILKKQDYCLLSTSCLFFLLFWLQNATGTILRSRCWLKPRNTGKPILRLKFCTGQRFGVLDQNLRVCCGGGNNPLVWWGRGLLERERDVDCWLGCAREKVWVDIGWIDPRVSSGISCCLAIPLWKHSRMEITRWTELDASSSSSSSPSSPSSPSLLYHLKLWYHHHHHHHHFHHLHRHCHRYHHHRHCQILSSFAQHMFWFVPRRGSRGPWCHGQHGGSVFARCWARSWCAESCDIRTLLSHVFFSPVGETFVWLIK